MAGALDGIRVIDLTMNVLGPLAGQLLGDAGADVIKVESRQGDPTRYIGPAHTPGMSAYFLNLNRNKRSIVLDLKSPEGRTAMGRLVDTADVFLHNLRLDAIARLGLDYASLRARKPAIIHAGASGFRMDSDNGDTPAFDDTIQGMSGLAVFNGGQDELGTRGPPRFVPSVIADKICGHALASAVAMALFHRERTGEGQQVHVPMFDTTVAFIHVEHLWAATVGGTEVGYPRMLTPHRRPYATRDGYLCILSSTDEQWRRLFPAIDRPELASDPRFATLPARSANINALYGTLSAEIVRRSTAEWRAILLAADVPHGPINALEDLLGNDYLRDGNFFETISHPTGAMTLMAPTTAYSATPAAIRLAPPMLGEHTAEILAELN